MEYRLDELLFQGETVEEEVDLTGAKIAVTSHRVLALTPEGDGKRFDHADLPNVVGAEVTQTGDARVLNWAVKAGVGGIALLSGGYVLDSSDLLGSLTQVSLSDNQAVAGAGEMVDMVSMTLGLLTGVMLLAGVAITIAALGVLGFYLYTRTRELVIDVAGREPIRVTLAEDEGAEAVEAVRRIV